MNLSFTEHARERMYEMDVGPAEVLDAIEHYDLRYHEGADRWFYAGGRLQVVVQGPRIITVIWRNELGAYHPDRTTPPRRGQSWS